MTLVQLRKMMIEMKKKYLQLLFHHPNKDDLKDDINNLIFELEQCMLDLSIDIIEDDVKSKYMDMVISFVAEHGDKIINDNLTVANEFLNKALEEDKNDM